MKRISTTYLSFVFALLSMINTAVNNYRCFYRCLKFFCTLRSFAVVSSHLTSDLRSICRNDDAREEKTKNETAEDRTFQVKMSGAILACISNAYINKVLILTERSFVSPSPGVWKLPSGIWVNTPQNLREESAGITIRNCKETRQ